MVEGDVRDRVWQYIKDKTALHEAASPVGAVEHLHMTLHEATAAFNELEKEGKISRIHRNLAVFELVVDDSELAPAVTAGTETRKEEGMTNVSFENATLDWKMIRYCKSFAKLGVSSVGELLQKIETTSLEEAVPVGPKPECVNVMFQKKVRRALPGLRQHAAELDKLPPPESSEGKGRVRARKQKMKKSAPVGKRPRKSVESSEVEPTTFRHRRKKSAEAVVSNRWQMLDVYSEIAEVGLALRRVVDVLKDTSEIAKLRDFLGHKLNQKQSDVLRQQFGWLIRPANAIVHAVDEVLEVK